MDFRLGERAEEFREEVRAFLAEHLTTEIVERVHDTGTVHDWDFYRAYAAKGWMAPEWPVEDGGQGRDPFEMTALREELRLAGAPTDGMGTTLLVANTLRVVGTEEQKAEILPRVLRGDIVICLGYTEPDCGSDAAAARTRAVRDGEEWVIDGQKMFTTLAHESDYVFLLTRTDTEVPKHKGLTMFLVPMGTPGIEIEPVHTLGGERTNITFYSGVRVPDSARVGDVDKGWSVMRVALAFEHLGGFGYEIDRLLRDTVAALESEPDGDGPRLADDPATLERLGEMAVDAEVSRALAYAALWDAHTTGIPGPAGSMTKLFSSEALQRWSAEVLDMLGPRALLEHGEPGAAADGWPTQMFRHAPVTTIYGGTSEVHRTIVGERALGLPRAGN